MTGDASSIGPARRDQRGAALLIVLVFLLVATLAAGSMVEAYQTQAQRDKEKELLFVGDQYRRAIASYYSTVPPGRGRSLPLSLDDLVRDNRFPVPVQHLRRHYPDPITGRSDWAVVLEGGGIVGVHSQSQLEPLKQSGFPARYSHFENQPTYADWVFRIELR